MKLTRQQFQEKFEKKELRIAFIGMSNIGKSHWTKFLTEQKGFASYSVDVEIQKNWDLDDMAKATTWMGYPFEEKFAKNEVDYLVQEREKTLACPLPKNKNLILDTTGSVIYMKNDVKEFLQENFLIINLDVSKQMCRSMKEQFFISPKTIVWGNSFNQKEGENGLDAIRRCYPDLLNYRIEKYREWGELFIPGEVSNLKGLDGERFWEIIKLSLPK
jgi:shikimate kinase